MFWRGVAFWRRRCSVLEGCDILEEALAVFWRGWHFLKGACSVLKGCGIFGGRMQCLGGA